jgi:hypothetical protein
MSWQDEKFREIVANENGPPYDSQIDWSRHWSPKYDFTNDVEITYVNRYHTSIYTEALDTTAEQGTYVTRVKTRVRIKGVFFERFELGGFPFDIQSLRVGIRARRGTGKMYFAPPRIATHASAFAGSRFKLPEWTFVHIKGPNGTPFTKFSPTQSEIFEVENPLAKKKGKSLFIFNMPVARREGFCKSEALLASEKILHLVAVTSHRTRRSFCMQMY